MVKQVTQAKHPLHSVMTLFVTYVMGSMLMSPSFAQGAEYYLALAGKGHESRHPRSAVADAPEGE